MSLKHSLIALTLISVVADTMLLPFYPQFFSQAFGVDSAQHVGFYIAAAIWLYTHRWSSFTWRAMTAQAGSAIMTVRQQAAM